MKAHALLQILLLALVSGAALAGAPVGGDMQVPEPGILELLALGGVVAAVAVIRKRRK